MNEDIKSCLDQQDVNHESLKEMKFHYKRLKKDLRKRTRRSAWPLRIIIALIILVMIFTGYKLIEKKKAEANMVQEDLQVIPVTLTTLQQMNLEQLYKGNGDIVASSTIDVYPDTATGKVTRIVTDLGDYVNKGQTILWIDPSRPGQTYAESPVKAPISGTITNMNASVGSQVSAQMPIATVGDLRNLQLETQIPEKYVSSVKLGQNIRISLVSWQEDRWFTGRIVEISPVVDPNSRTLKVTMNILSDDPTIKAGMFARISMVIETFENSMVLPSQAIVERFDEQFVYIIEDDKAIKRPIESSISLNGFSKIDQGVVADDRVVLMGNNLLEDGSSVKILEGN
jgi:membrane fusion protein (multidrug efflux system)